MDYSKSHEGCSEECPIKKAAKVIEGKWTTLVIRELLTGEKRYFELQNALTGISPKVLSARLRSLEKHQLISRHVFATIPLTTEYKLTMLGKKMQPLLMAMADFGIELGLEEDHSK
ncbi:transcriptional regulator [Marinomonas sp. 42_23_T18]|nr:transcriptional regulator [Marinomonas sp. 42_23_T18]